MFSYIFKVGLSKGSVFVLKLNTIIYILHSSWFLFIKYFA